MHYISFSGYSGAGKTTLILKLIEYFTIQGKNIAAIKHAHHDYDIDIKGKDSYEYRAAGAQKIIVASAKRVSFIEEHQEYSPNINSLMPLLLQQQGRACHDTDLVLIEGFKRDNIPKLVIWHPGKDNDDLWRNSDNVLSIIYGDIIPNIKANIPLFHRDDITNIAQYIERNAPIWPN